MSAYKGYMGTTQPTSGTTALNTRKFDVSPQVFLLDRYNNPLTHFLTTIGKSPAPDGQSYQGVGLKEKETIDPRFEFFEDTFGQTSFVLADTGTNIIGSATEETLTVDDGAFNMNVADLLLNPSRGEIYFVKSITSDTSVEVERGFSSTAVTTAAADDVIINVGNASREADDNIDSSHTVKTSVFGLTQIFKTNVSISGTLDNTELYTGSEWEEQKAKKAIEHAQKIERALLWSKKGEQAVTIGSSAQVARSTDGIFNRLAGVQTDVTGAMDEGEFIGYLESLFTYASPLGYKYLLAGGGVLSDIQAFARASNNELNIAPGADKLGVKIFEYTSAFGDVKIVNHPMMTQSAVYTNQAIGLDMETIMLRYLKNRKAVYRENVQSNGADSRTDQYLSEVGLQIANPQRSRILTIGN